MKCSNTQQLLLKVEILVTELKCRNALNGTDDTKTLKYQKAIPLTETIFMTEENHQNNA